jgi:phosphoribosyl 1,2-cyclic phosphate phosphodiesterase
MSGRVLSVRVLGCGSSGGVPRIGNDWGLCDPAEPRNRRSRCSILLKTRAEAGGPETVVLIDTSPDLREQLLAARVTRLDAVVLTHSHADQCHGLDDLRALVIRQRRRMRIHMDAPTAEAVIRRFDYCFADQPAYPAILEARVDLAPGSVLKVAGEGPPLDLLTLDLDHGSMRSLGFRIGNFAYCNDVVRIPEETFDRLHGLEVLMVDALRHAAHPTHANLDMALEWIERIKPRRAYLTNMHVDMDYRSLIAKLPDHVTPCHDGLELSFSLNT